MYKAGASARSPACVKGKLYEEPKTAEGLVESGAGLPKLWVAELFSHNAYASAENPIYTTTMQLTSCSTFDPLLVVVESSQEVDRR